MSWVIINRSFFSYPDLANRSPEIGMKGSDNLKRFKDARCLGWMRVDEQNISARQCELRANRRCLPFYFGRKGRISDEIVSLVGRNYIHRRFSVRGNKNSIHFLVRSISFSHRQVCTCKSCNLLYHASYNVWILRRATFCNTVAAQVGSPSNSIYWAPQEIQDKVYKWRNEWT
jgi:hypothetical protein